MIAILRRCFIHFIGRPIILTRILIITDKCITEEVHWECNLNSTARYKADNLWCRWKQGLTLLNE